MIALKTKDITKKYKKKVAVNEVTISLEEHKYMVCSVETEQEKRLY